MAASIFAPPRNRPKISLSKPTLAAGQPFQPIQTINRPVNLVDDEGNVHGRLGENPHGPEQVTVTPPPGATNDPAGGPDYASGGTLLIGGGGTQSEEASTNPYPSTIGTGIFGGSWQPPASNPYTATIGTGVFGQNWQPPSLVTTPQQQQPQGQPGWWTNPATDPNATQFAAQQHQIDTRNSALDYRAKVLDAKSQNRPLIQAQNQAKQNVLNLQGQGNQLQKSYYQQQGMDEQARLGELQGIYSASQNTPDLMNVAQAKNAYSSENRRDSEMGVAPSAEVNLAPGANPPRIAGVRPKIKSQEEALQERAGYEDPIRAEKLQLAKNIVDLQITDVRAASLAAEQAGLTLSQANDLVEQAQLEADYAGIVSQRADISASAANLPPSPGLVKWTNPSDGVGLWVTPEVQKQLETQASGRGPLTHPQLLNTIPPNFKDPADISKNPGVFDPIIAQITQDFVKQGYDQDTARNAAIAMVTQELNSRRSGGTLTLPAPGQQQTPVTPAPAGAPSNQPAPGTPQLPPGYKP